MVDLDLDFIATRANLTRDDTLALISRIRELEKQDRNQYAEGYENSQKDMYQTGYSDGYEEGSSDKYEEGYRDGQDKGYSTGYKEGYSDGYLDGENLGSNGI